MIKLIPHSSPIITSKIAISRAFFCFLVFFSLSFANAQTQGTADQAKALRSFDELFPGLAEEQKQKVFGREGLVHTLDKGETPQLIPASGSGIDLYSRIMQKKPAYLAESLSVVSYSGRTLDRLDGYNALGNVRDLKGRLYHSESRQADVPLFEEATRIENAEKDNPIPDPQSAKVLPLSETVYIRVKDINFGDCYYRGELSTTLYGIIYSLTNFKSLSYFVFTIIKEENFTATMYMEPLAEGMLVYIMAGADTSDFIGSRVSIPSALAKRGGVFLGWFSDNLKKIP